MSVRKLPPPQPFEPRRGEPSRPARASSSSGRGYVLVLATLALAAPLVACAETTGGMRLAGAAPPVVVPTAASVDEIPTDQVPGTPPTSATATTPAPVPPATTPAPVPPATEPVPVPGGMHPVMPEALAKPVSCPLAVR